MHLFALAILAVGATTDMAFAAPPPMVPPSVPPAPNQPFSPQLFDNNFLDKQDPDHTYVPGEDLKDIPLGGLCGLSLFDDAVFSTGGELRFRYIDEVNRLRPGGPGDSSYDQWRWRHYLDVRTTAWRAYVELIDASTNHHELPLQGIDEDRWDLQNYFLDLDVSIFGDTPVWLRVGRQELLYGSQRLVSPLDWSNIRRRFEGLKLFTRTDAWNVDLWIANPVSTAVPGVGSIEVSDNSFDQREEDYLFGGVFTTYKGWKDQTLDLFFLYTNINYPTNGLPFGDRYTVGTRWLGTLPWSGDDHVFQGEVEGGYQFGNDRSAFYDAASPRASVQAGYFTIGAGHTWKSLAWQPSLWAYWDWASGDRSPTDGENNTFFQMVGFFHAYLGLIDNIGRQNISDINLRWTAKPDPKLQVLVACHWFQLQTDTDVLYNVIGAPVGTPGNGSDVGSELDLQMTYTVSPNWSIDAGFFWFWYGDYIGAVAPRGTAEQLFVMSTWRY
jgi:hypothetical protein